MKPGESKKTDYEWLSEQGLCHRCRKARPAPGRKYCFDCLDKIREENAKRYDPEKARAYLQRRREIYWEKKEAGICVRCSRPATHGLYCYEHSIAVKRHSRETEDRRKRERHERGLVPEYRKEKGLCLWCGGELGETRHGALCAECAGKASEYGKRSAQKKDSPFRIAAQKEVTGWQRRKRMREYKVFKLPDGSIYAQWSDMIDKYPNGSHGGKLIATGECGTFKELIAIKRTWEK